MKKKMNCPYCNTELENDGLYIDGEDGFQCAKCGKDYDGDGKEIEDYKNEQGFCPKCSSGNIDYGSAEFVDGMIYFPYKCKDCGTQGEEWYSMEFQGHNIYNKDGEIIEL